MFSNDLIPLINLLKEETKNFYSLLKKCYHEKIPHKKEIMKLDINDSIYKINIINSNIKSNIDHYKKLVKIKSEISKEFQIKNNLDKKSKKVKDFIEKGKNILINKIPYYEKLPEYSNKKLKKANLFPLDLINFTLRLSQQSKAPPGGYTYLDIMMSLDNISSFYLKNKNRYLHPYPKELEMKQSILYYDFSEEKRLLPPLLLEPDPKKTNKAGFILANLGSIIRLKYPKDNMSQDIKFKYSIDKNVLPSTFSGEEYKATSGPQLEKDCIFKVCSCKKGFKDSKIITYVFVVDPENKDTIITRTVGANPGEEGITKIYQKIDTGIELKFGPISSNPWINKSRNSSYRIGTDNYPGTIKEKSEDLLKEKKDKEGSGSNII